MGRASLETDAALQTMLFHCMKVTPCIRLDFSNHILFPFVPLRIDRGEGWVNCSILTRRAQGHSIFQGCESSATGEKIE